VLQLVFFISPVIWIPNDVKGLRSVLLNVNPVAHLLNVLRNPLMGLPVPMNSVVILSVSIVVGWIVTFLLYASVRRRIVHYL
jgi:ABC-type polysaccharide/polyol phosphate export permease